MELERIHWTELNKSYKTQAINVLMKNGYEKELLCKLNTDSSSAEAQWRLVTFDKAFLIHRLSKFLGNLKELKDREFVELMLEIKNAQS